MYMYIYAHNKKNFSKNIFIFKILVLGLMENYRDLLIGCTKNSGYESLTLREYDFGQVMGCTGKTFIVISINLACTSRRVEGGNLKFDKGPKCMSFT